MLNYREFDAGPDPFGRKFHILFKWLQTAISIRHADTVDVKFIILDDDGGSTQKTIALQHAELVAISKETGRKMDDPWCARLAAQHLLRLIETGEDMEKDLVTVAYPDLKAYVAGLGREEGSTAGVR